VSHWGLRKKGIEPLYPDEWNTVLDALDQLFDATEDSVKKEDLQALPSDIIPDADAQRNLGSQDKAWLSVNAHSGNFIDSLTVQGKPVLKDGDPITVSDLGDNATSKITQAVNNASVTVGNISDTATAKVTSAVNNSVVAQYLGDLRGRVLQFRLDDSGNIGVSVVEGDAFKEAMAYGAVTASGNTAGFSVTLAKGGRPYVNVYYRLGGAGIIYVRVSVDGSNWRTLDTISLASGGEGVKIYTGIAYPYVLVGTDETGIDAEFEVVASR